MLDRRRLGCGGLSGGLSVEQGRSFQVRGFHRSDWARRCGSNFFDYGFFDYEFLDYGRGLVSRGWNFGDGGFGRRFVDGEFGDGLDGGNFFHGRSGLGRGFDFSSKRV